MLAGLFVGFAPEPHLAALRRARRGSSTSLREGDFVWLEGVITAAEPLTGPVSQQTVAAFRVLHYRPVRQGDQHERIRHAEQQSALGLAVRDQEGSVELQFDEGTLVSKNRRLGTQASMGDRWTTTVFEPEVVELAEHSIAVGAQVVAMGEAARVEEKWVLRGRDAFLSDVTLEELRSVDRRNRLAGQALIALSIACALLYFVTRAS